MGYVNATTHHANGELTKYGLSCGYVQRNGEITLTRDGVYHVKDGLGYWESYLYLTDARRDYAKQVKLWQKPISN